MRPTSSRLRRLVVVLTVAGLAAISSGCTTSPRGATSTDQTTGTTATTTGNAAVDQPSLSHPPADRTPTAPGGSARPSRLPRVSAAGAILHRPSSSDPAFGGVDGGPSLTCAQLATAASAARLGARRCGQTTLAPTGRRVIWIAGRTDANRPELQVWAYDRGGWTDQLVARDPDGSWDRIEVLTPGLGHGGQTLVAKFFTATGADGPDVLSYDLVHAVAGFGHVGLLGVVAHRDLDRGRLFVTGAVLDDYSADPNDGAPFCCPRRFDHARIAFVAGAFRYLQGGPATLPKPLTSIRHGGRYWGVYWTGSPRERRQVQDQLARLGIRAGYGDIGCDHGAGEQLGIRPRTIAVSVYFARERDARSFAQWAGTHPPPTGYARVTTYCLD